jgi:retinol dehydrogenase-12
MTTKSLLVLIATLALAYAGGKANQTIGAPCKAGEDAMGLFQSTDLMGKIAIITGSDTGIGKEIARALAARNATVVMAVRKIASAQAAAADIKKDVPHANIVIPEVGIDLSSFNLTRAYAIAANKAIGGRPVHWLINDAAMSNNPHGYEGADLDQNGKPFEMLFEVNYVSQFLLTELLLPQLRASGEGRVINLVSKAYRMSCPMSERRECMVLENMPPPVITTDPNKTVPLLGIKPTNYGIAKLLMVRWTEELASRETAAGTGVTTFSVDPGYVNTTMATQTSKFWTKLSCADEGRKGAPCPVPSNQGALTPTFLALAPDMTASSGKYFEWCAEAPLTHCIDSVKDMMGGVCALSSESDKQALWELSTEWVKGWTDPITAVKQLPLEQPDNSLFTCPKILQPLCNIVKTPLCFMKCIPQLKACIDDTTCRASLASSGECMGKHHGASANDQLKCLVPDNKLRDDFFLCSMDTNACIPLPQDNTSYPACRETNITGDSKFSPEHVVGDWWKLQGWTAGEQYECRPCGQVNFWDAPQNPHQDTNTVVISSTWLEKDFNNKSWTMNDTSFFGPRPDHKGYPVHMEHYGAMYGLSYLENFTVVHDGTAEAEPFIFLYGCGGTKQGTYVTGFVLGKTPTASSTLQARIDQVAVANGFGTKQWCKVDNSCSKTQKKFN